jgi:uncharacterized protein (DUF2336 family)
MPTELRTKYSPLSLSEQEVLDLLENKTPNVLVNVTNKIAGAYGGQLLKSKDTAASEQIFRLLMRETELRVRVTLAEHVKKSGQLPRDIAMSMARDVEEVSLPILQHSQVLDDHDLVELISHTQDVSRYLAISRRERVSHAVSDVLLAKENEEITSSLVANNGAEISGEGFAKIVEFYPHNERVMQALSDRPHVPAAIIEKMLDKVSTSLAARLKEKYKVAGREIDAEIEIMRESETLKLVKITHAQEDVDNLVSQMQTSNRLTPSLILSALCQGNFCFFETGLAQFSNIPVSSARALINDRGQLGFRAIYNKSGLRDSMFPAVRILLNAVRDLDTHNEKPASPGYAERIVERILKDAEGEQVENLSYIIALVRQAAQ